MMRSRLFGFPGGLRLPRWKDLSDHAAIMTAPVPDKLIIPLQQHTGDACRPVVAVGDRVSRGDRVGQPPGYYGACIHAASSGTVIALENHPVIGGSAPCVVIRTDGADTWSPCLPPPLDPGNIGTETLIERLWSCGVVGMGGATFPTDIKLAAARAAGVRLLIINGIECEPGITCDDRLIRERAREVVLGTRLFRDCLAVDETLLALEEDRTEARTALEQALADTGETGIRVVSVPARYPSGSERQLIEQLTGREVPSGGLPLDIGMLCQNVGTVAAAWRAITRGEPVTGRIVTVTGQGVCRPANIEARLGTPLAELIELAGGYTDSAARLVMGGPMMGVSLTTDALPLTKGCNCLLVGDNGDLPAPQPAMPCIRCGACADACPVLLLPQQLHWHALGQNLDSLRSAGLDDCIECGACAVVCPSHIPLVREFRDAKTAIAMRDLERERAERARQRFAFRQQRLERERREAEEQRRRKKEALARASESASGGDDPRKAAIQAAVERARRKRAASRPGHGQSVPTADDERT